MRAKYASKESLDTLRAIVEFTNNDKKYQFTVKELIGNKCPYATRIKPVLTEYGYIDYFNNLLKEIDFDKFLAQLRDKSKRQKVKHNKRLPVKGINLMHNIDIDTAVKYLKYLGYRVLKPVTDYEEI